jgi:putative membrane protein
MEITLRRADPFSWSRAFPSIAAVRAALHTTGSMPRPEALNQHQANERTMLAWFRTGISLMGFGFAIAKFGLYVREVVAAGHVGLPEAAVHHVGSGWVGAALVAVGMFTNFFATLRFRRIRRAIEREDVETPGSLLAYVIGGMTTVIGLIMMVLLLVALHD